MSHIELGRAAGLAAATEPSGHRSRAQPGRRRSGSASRLTRAAVRRVGLAATVLLVAVATVPVSAAGGAVITAGSSPVWHASVPPLPALPPNPDETVAALACPAAERCVGVGSYLDSGGDRLAMILTETSAGWNERPVPLPSGTDASTAAPEMSSIACVAPGSCTAVGDLTDRTGAVQGLIVNERGGAWHAGTAPLPKGLENLGQYGSLDSVACPRATACAAIGLIETIYTVQGVLFVEASGRWSAELAPLPAAAGAGSSSLLYGLACASVGRCVATGAYVSPGGLFLGAGGPDAAAHPGPLPCERARTCLAPGLSLRPRSSGGAGALIDTLSAGAWTSAEAPLPPDAAEGIFSLAELDSVSCPTVTSCVAVGSYLAGSFPTFNERGLMVSESGSVWSATAAPADVGASDAQVALRLVSCASTGTCTAIGDVLSDTGDETLIVTGSEGNWSALELAPPHQAMPSSEVLLEPQDLTCDVSGCTAVELEAAGNASAIASEAFGSLILSSRSGDAWVSEETPAPGGGTAPQVFALCCRRPPSCVAAGDYYDADANEHGLLVTTSTNGVSSSESPTPVGAGFATATVALRSVRCIGPRYCSALGELDNDGAAVAAVAETRINGAWSSTEVPLPADATSPQILLPGPVVFALACARPGSCRGVGEYADSSGSLQPLVVTQSGSSWTSGRAELPRGAATTGQTAALETIACTGTDRCTAVGTFTGTKGNIRPLVVSESGAGWEPSTASLPAAVDTLGPDGEFAAIACAGAQSCAAVGDYDTNAEGETQPVILSERAGGWSSRQSPLPKGAAGRQIASSDLDAISCPGPSGCVAVGHYVAANGDQPGLIVTETATGWRAAAAPLPLNGARRGSELAEIDAVDCADSSYCAATGEYLEAYTPAGRPNAGEIFEYAGSKWSSFPSPVPIGPPVALAAVDIGSLACPTADSCVAAGDYQLPLADGSSITEGLLLTENPVQWSAVNAPLPAGSGVSNLGLDGAINAVSCGGVGSCVAVGTFDSAAGVPTALVETLAS